MKRKSLRDSAYWKRLGFSVLPKTVRIGSMAMSARDCLSALPCWAQASKMVDAGYMPGQIADFIRDQKDGRDVTMLTMKKYIQLYRRHFVPPAKAVKGTLERVKMVKSRGSKNDGSHNSPPPQSDNSPPSDTGGKGDGGGDMINQKTPEQLDAFRTGSNEIALMEQVILLQFERVKSQRELEKSLASPLPKLWREIEQITKLARKLVNLKADLDLDGYLRVPKMIHGRRPHDMVPRMLAGLSDHDRQALAEFGKTLTELIRKSDGSDAEKE